MTNTKKSVFNWQVYLGVVLILTGGVFLVDLIFPVDIMNFFWPLLIVLFGLTFFVGMVVGGKRSAGLAVPGTIITTVGLLLFVQNTFNLWVTWAYAWALLISAVGLGMLIMNAYLKREGVRRVAGLLIGIGLTLFVVFGVFFEIILNIAGTDVNSGVFLGAGLVLLGLFVVFSRPLFAREGKSQTADAGAPTETTSDIFEEPEVAAPVPGEGAIHPLAEGTDFTGLRFKSIGEVFLSQGQACSLEIEGDQELLENIRAEVVDGELSISYTADVADWTGLQMFTGEPRLRYFVTMKAIEHVDLGGAGDLQGDHIRSDSLRLVHSGLGKMRIGDLDCQELDVKLTGLGKICVDGIAVAQTVELRGAGSYEAESLKSQQVKVQLSGAGSAKVWAEDELEASVNGAGSIRYKGNPNVTQSKQGVGDIKPI